MDANPIQTPPTAFSRKCKGVVIDGANILSAKPVSVQRLVNTIQYARDLGWKVLVGLKAGTYTWMMKNENSPLDESSKKLLEDLVSSKTVSLLKDKTDDLHLIRIALNGPYYLLSQDHYRDWKKNNQELVDDIEACWLYVEVMGDEVSIDLPPSPHSTMCVPSIGIEIPASLAVKVNGEEKKFNIPYNTIIGKAWLADHGIENQYISRSHFRIVSNIDGLYLEDLKSKNGTFIDEMRLSAHHPHPLEDVKAFSIAGEVELLIET